MLLLSWLFRKKRRKELEILVGARDLLLVDSRWTKGAIARNAEGDLVNPWSNHAKSFCLVGAAVRTNHIRQLKIPYERILDILKPDNDNQPKGAMTFNDERETTHADVLNLLDKKLEQYRS